MRGCGENYIEYEWKGVERDFEYERRVWGGKWLGEEFERFGNGDEEWLI